MVSLLTYLITTSNYPSKSSPDQTTHKPSWLSIAYSNENQTIEFSLAVKAMHLAPIYCTLHVS